MRRIYESEALRRDDEDPHAPGEHDETTPQSFRSVNAGSLSRMLVPDRVRRWAVSVDVSTPRRTYTAGSRIPFAVTMKNAMPFPITIATRSPRLWEWSIDGAREASHVEINEAPERSGAFEFDRGERKQFRKRWDGMFRTGESEWEQAAPGTYTVSAGINVDDPSGAGLYDETTVRLEPE